MSMDRRDFVTAFGAIAAAGLVSKAAVGDEHVHPGAKDVKATAIPPSSKELKSVMDATAHCLSTGETCLGHCAERLAGGDTSMADCQRTVMNMLAICGAMFKTAAYHSADPAQLKALARVCADFCRACAKTCEVHAGHHEECKACMESCKDCATACDAYARA